MSDQPKRRRSKTLFIRNLAPEITEEVLKTKFKACGTIKDCYMPKDHKTGKPKLFAFLEFATKEEAQSVVNSQQRFSLFGKQLEISYALEQQRHHGSSRDQTPPRSYHRSRSRSPMRKSHLDSDMRSRLDKLQRENNDLYQQKYEYMAEITSLKDDLKIKRREIEKLKDQLDSINSKRTLFLPCGHTKILKSQEIQLIDSLYNEAVTRLLPEERKNEFILTRLKRKIFYILEAKYPQIFRCKIKELSILGECGHTVSKQCWRLRNFNRGLSKILCKQTVEKLLPCGHKIEVECFQPLEQVKCFEC